jgi:hypothetical protein
VLQQAEPVLRLVWAVVDLPWAVALELALSVLVLVGWAAFQSQGRAHEVA